MLTVTDTAASHLSKLLDSNDAPDEAAVRMVVDQQGIGLAMDTEKPGDATFEHEGKTVLLLDEQVSQLLDEKTLDVQDGEQGPAFAIR